MPGGRLTQQERQQIALGVADGLAYAEIARRIDRPTSTVTREVMRNGGPTGYRADLAHHATERRAHRRQPATRSAAPERERDDDAMREFEESLSAIFIHQGLPRMTARVLACLYLTDKGSITATELVHHLQVSPASISKAITLLDGLNLIRRERDDRRRERYVVDNELWYESMLTSARSNTELAAVVRQGAGVLGPASAAGIRLENVARFLEFVGESTMRAAEQAREILFTEPPKS